MSRSRDDQRLRSRGDGILPLLPLHDFAYTARLLPVTSPLVAIIDDDDALCSSLVDLMRSVGYRAEPYSSAETFLTSVNLLNSQCLVADVHMPGMSGINLVKSLREQDIMTPVILITALSGKHLDDEAISVGAHCLLRKPFKTDTLLDCIERILADERTSR